MDDGEVGQSMCLPQMPSTMTRAHVDVRVLGRRPLAIPPGVRWDSRSLRNQGSGWDAIRTSDLNSSGWNIWKRAVLPAVCCSFCRACVSVCAARVAVRPEKPDR